MLDFLRHPILARLASLGAIALFLALAAHQAGRPLHLDTMDFPAVAKAAAETGRPIYYRGEDNPQHNGLYHPPLYIYALAGWFKVFGSGAAQARMFGALCALAFGWTTLLLARALLGREELLRLAPWFWALFLLNPFTLQCSAIPDIDTTIYGPLLTLLLWSVLRISWRGGERRLAAATGWSLVLVAALLALCLWAKLTTILAFLPFLPLLFPAEWRWRGRALATAFVLVAGGALFLATYLGFGRLLGLDVNYSFQFLAQSFSQRGHMANPLANLAVMTKHLLRWTGLLPWAVFALWCGASLLAAWRRREARAQALATVLSLTGAVTAYYCARAMTFGNAPFKYVFVGFGAVAASLAYLAWHPRPPAPQTAPPPGTGAGKLATTPLAAGAVAVLCGGVGLLLGARYVRDGVIQNGWSAPFAWVLALPLAVAAVGLAPRALFRGSSGGAGPLLISAALCLHLGLQLGIASFQSRMAYSTTYDYGQRGLAEAAAFVRQRTGGDDVISSMKDLGFLAERRYIENYSALFSDPEARRLIAAWESGRVRFIVFTEEIGQDQLAYQPSLRDWLTHNAVLAASFGNYRIYRPLTVHGR